ncbi:Putative NADH-flavin reductase [Staphylococcus piscifermentans]|uniref:NAD-dependent dehydratase n=1 Tax=Staphylococcus piscifermentans TaxID=70258 RepID=A0A239TFG1_9STAP|nr:NAD-dependent epimerase/dehydratase family protein [Staphylococcus piscifermentans]RTX83098.1 NAD-dependent epimerase/dehydratase family protein [Staphylococcus piscifermentans]GEP85085.1 NAD-dependent dehydratase [Staphylococcus piscifermentans]SNU95654.1 Putative NADH-flavin reductase [Staphylococcus piscifermentans]
MQTVLGSNGQIGQEIAKELYKNYTKDIRLVSRKPHKIHDTDEVVPADLMKYEDTLKAIEGSDVVYFAVGLPADSEMWEKRFPVMMENVIKACAETHSKLAFFDNTYMYEKNANVQTESSPFVPVGRKSKARAKMAEMLLTAMKKGKIEALIGRAPEFYGPDLTQSITNSLVFNRVKADKKAIIPISASVLRTLIWTPDASRALALLGNTPDAFGQTWHLPTDKSVTYKKLIEITKEVTGKNIKYTVLPMWAFKIGSLFNGQVKELMELLPRYKYNNIFNSDKFKKRFPEFKVTTYKEGIQQVFKK